MADALDQLIQLELKSLPAEIELLVRAFACDAEDVSACIIESGARDTNVLKALVRLFSPTSRGELRDIPMARLRSQFGDREWMCCPPDITGAENGTAMVAMLAACDAGNAASTQWIARHFGFTRANLPALFGTCALHLIKADLALIRWVVKQFEIGSPDVFRSIGDERMYSPVDNLLMDRFCARGQVADVEWLVDAFGIDPASYCSAVEYACARNNLEVVLWLSDRSDGTYEGVEAIFDMFYRVCKAGMLDVTGAMLDYFDPGQLRGPDIAAGLLLNSACGRGDLKMAELVAGHLDMSGVDAWRVLGSACIGGNIGLVGWAAERFDPLVTAHMTDSPAERARLQAGNLLRSVCARGHADIAMWLIERYSMSAAEACEQLPLSEPAELEELAEPEELPDLAEPGESGESEELPAPGEPAIDATPTSAWEYALRLPDARLARWMSDRFGWGLHVFI